jgi:DNA-binding NtrC family response regulator
VTPCPAPPAAAKLEPMELPGRYALAVAARYPAPADRIARCTPVHYSGPVGQLQDAIDATVRTQLRLALTATGGKRKPAADFLGVSLRKLHNLLAEYPDIAEEFPAAKGRPREGG